MLIITLSKFCLASENLCMKKFVNVMNCKSFLKVSQVYQTMQFSRLQALVPFATEFQLERAIVDIALENELQVEVINYSVIVL